MDREFLIGVDINSKTITVGLVDLSGKIVKKMSIPSEISKGKKKVIDNIANAVNRIKKNKILGVGISVPGIVNREKGIVLESPFAGWENLALKKAVEDLVQCPVFIESEGRCFTIAEYKCGTFRKIDNSIGVYFNDHISTGIMIDGKLAKGFGCAAGCVNHSVVDSKKTKLEEIASIAAIEKDFRAKTRKAKPINDIVASETEKSAKEVLRTAGIHFGTAMSHVVNVLNPEMIIVGGPLGRSEEFISAAESTIQNKSNEICGKRVKIVGSKMNDSTLLGAASIII